MSSVSLSVSLTATAERHVGYDLRDRGHSHELIAHKYKMTRSSFIVRTLFDNM